MNKIEKPEFRWYFGLPLAKLWNKGAKDYYKDRERYDLSFLKESEKIRYNQGKMIYSIDALVFFILTSLWSALPQFIELPNLLTFMKLGMENVSWQSNWAGAIMLTIVPGSSSWLIHKVPTFFPMKKVRIAIDSILKILPIILLILFYYLINTEMKYKSYKKLEREKLLAEVIGQNTE
ncbi:hypothetical protein [Spiroplasma endosymbiont of Atherix ibis]|uniref:hypothetical protein n=1 Tax=Spiroplasma endosymbiont of Atherix ibis TaxID=3066291 RepID=UPI0030D11D93